MEVCTKEGHAHHSQGHRFGLMDGQEPRFHQKTAAVLKPKAVAVGGAEDPAQLEEPESGAWLRMLHWTALTQALQRSAQTTERWIVQCWQLSAARRARDQTRPRR